MQTIPFLGVCLAVVLGASSVPTTAQEAPSEAVYYLDLDLRSDAGVRSLDNRIRKAVRKVCGGVPRGGYFEWMLYADCRTATLASVIPARDAVVQKARTREGLVEILAISVAPNSPAK